MQYHCSYWEDSKKQCKVGADSPHIQLWRLAGTSVPPSRYLQYKTQRSEMVDSQHVGHVDNAAFTNAHGGSSTVNNDTHGRRKVAVTNIHDENKDGVVGNDMDEARAASSDVR